jgi:hypothetical protein
VVGCRWAGRVAGSLVLGAPLRTVGDGRRVLWWRVAGALGGCGGALWTLGMAGWGGARCAGTGRLGGSWCGNLLAAGGWVGTVLWSVLRGGEPDARYVSCLGAPLGFVRSLTWGVPS